VKTCLTQPQQVPFNAFGGYIVAVAYVLLNERGILPEQKQPGPFSQDQDDGALIWAGLEEAVLWRRKLAEFISAISDDELADFYNDFTDEEWVEAGAGTHAALEFIEKALAAVTTPQQMLVVTVA